ncbi:vacuolar protein sorting-associated protein 16 homolog [Petromyzon marinus]|uniref:vacuolar protein sorting-associated protein 16 homolog n=1 Tax=Petromyzon marinus TaxID=7757 RepID=UPI003F724A47
MWCGYPGQGPPVVVVECDDVMMLTSCNNHHEPIRFPVDSDSVMVQEVDGVRILNKYSHDFVYRLSEASVNVFRIGSMEPGALLLEASREYESDSQKADEYLRAIREQGSLEVAVDECIAAACNHGQARTQKMLLRAAAFGKCFVSAGCAGRSPRGQRPAFVEACRHLRLLNAVRDPAVAMPLTYTQLEHLTIPVLIDRLVARRMFALAVKICELLRLPDPQGRSRVLAHWACYKVESDVPDEALALLMNRRLGDAPGLSYTEIAARATHLGRRDLAVKVSTSVVPVGTSVVLVSTSVVLVGTTTTVVVTVSETPPACPTPRSQPVPLTWGAGTSPSSCWILNHGQLSRYHC